MQLFQKKMVVVNQCLPSMNSKLLQLNKMVEQTKKKQYFSNLRKQELMNKFGTNQISIVNEMLRTEVEETQEFIKQANTFKGINFPSHQTTKHPQCPPKTNTP